MDILLIRTYKYTVKESVENVRANILKITSARWYDFTNNITGTLKEDNSFELTHKWAFGYINGGGSFIYLSGIIKQESGKTIIETTLRPNIVLIFAFYFITALFFCELFGIKTMLQGPRIAGILILPVCCAIFLGIILFLGNGLRNRFERLLYLTRAE